MRKIVLLSNNYTDGDIFIKIERWEKPQEEDNAWTFNKKMGDLEISIDVYVGNSNILGSKKQMICLTFMPTWARTKIGGRSPYEFLRAIPMLDIVRSVIKSLMITNGQGDLLFSLEDAGEKDFTVSKDGNEIDYFLDIYDGR